MPGKVKNWATTWWLFSGTISQAPLQLKNLPSQREYCCVAVKLQVAQNEVLQLITLSTEKLESNKEKHLNTLENSIKSSSCIIKKPQHLSWKYFNRNLWRVSRWVFFIFLKCKITTQPHSYISVCIYSLNSTGICTNLVYRNIFIPLPIKQKKQTNHKNNKKTLHQNKLPKSMYRYCLAVHICYGELFLYKQLFLT